MIIARRGATVMAAAATVEASRRQQRASQALGWSNSAPGHKSIMRVRPGSLVSPVEKQKMVTLINDLVDLDNFTEDEEQIIFEFAIDKIVKVLNEDLTPIHYAMAHGDHTPLSKDKGKNLEARLFDHISTAVQLPFLDDIDERRIKRCVIALIVHSMMTDIPLQSVVEPENAKPIVVDILTKGIVNVFFEAEEKARLIEKLSQNVKNVPFVPIGIINLALEHCVGVIALHIKAALQVTTGEILSGKRDPIFMKDAHKLAAYSIVYEVEKAAAKKERKLRRRHNQVLGGTSGNADMGLPPTQANEQGDLIVVIEDDDDDDDEDDDDDDDEDDDNNICNRSFGQILTRNLATMLLLEMTFPLMADSFLAKQRAQMAYQASTAFLSTADFRKFDAFTKWSTGGSKATPPRK